MNRLTQAMDRLEGQGKKAFIAYLMAGEPSWEICGQILLGLERAGVTAVELGVPFSDPIADGPVIQQAADRALAGGVTLASIFERLRSFRRQSSLPILLMGYWNVFLQHGRMKSLRDACEAGVDGFIIPDLPPEADPEFFSQARADRLCTVLLAAELTPPERLDQIVRASTGFLYYVPQLGITGQDLKITESIKERIQLLKSATPLPVCIGIGVKTREDVRQFNQVADGVIVGTRIVQFIEERRGDPEIGAAVEGLVRSLME